MNQLRDQSAAAESRGDDPWRLVFAAAVTALLAATPLIPGEAVVVLGSGVVLISLWLIVALLWLLVGLLRRQLFLTGGATDLGVLLFAAVPFAGILALRHELHLRPAWNAAWHWAVVAIGFLLVRQLQIRGRAARAMAAVLIALAASQAALAVYQYFVAHPKLRATYLEDPDTVLQEAGINAPPDSLQRLQFERRLLRSFEPHGTFALANSLAGMLAPWLILLAAIGLRRRKGESRALAVTAGLAGSVMILAIILTKSRSAMLACLFGVAFLVVGLLRRHGIGVPRRPLIVVGLLVVGVLAVALWAGGVDGLVLSQARLSLQYRWEYWIASFRLMADSPVWGTGPGNFQVAYTEYKLPQASETIADPHNFVLEIASTLGLPALLVFLVVAVLLVRRCLQRAESDDPEKGAPNEGRPLALSIIAGAGVGTLIAYPVSWTVGLFPEPEYLVCAVLAGGPVIVGLWPWVREGSFPVAAMLLPVGVLLFNLLAAGGLTFPAVTTALWLLPALALTSADRVSNALEDRRPLGVPAVFVLLIALFVVVTLFQRTTFRPVLATTSLTREVEDALRRSVTDLDRVESLLQQAVEEDPRDATPAERLASFYFQHFLAVPDTEPLEAALEALRLALERNPRSARLHQMYGDWLLVAYHVLEEDPYLSEAVRSYRAAVDRYPASNRMHARLAWALHLSGDADGAAEEAARSLELDALVPHAEWKLAAMPDLPGSARIGGDAEQRMKQLRSRELDLSPPSDAPPSDDDPSGENPA